MYKSLLKWCTSPVSVVKYGPAKASGDKQKLSTTEYLAYEVDEMTLITDKTGKEYVSNAQIYFPGEVPVEEADFILLSDSTKQREIHRLSCFRDGNTGTVDIKVVYL